MDHSQGLYAFAHWKLLDWDEVGASGRDNAAKADATGDDKYLHLAVMQLVAAIPDGHVQSSPLSAEFPDCGATAEALRLQLKYDQ